MRSIGVDIGSFSVKIAEIESSSKYARLVRYHEFPLSPDPNRDKRIEIIDIMRQLSQGWEESDIVTIAIPQKNISLRRRTFPFRERHKILKSLAFELEDDIPFSQDDAVFEAKVTAFKGNQAFVLALACPKERVQDRISLAQDCGIEPDVLSMEGAALGSLVENWQNPPQEEVSAETLTPDQHKAEAWLSIGHENTLFTVFHNNQLIFTRSIDFGGKQVAEAISGQFHIHYLEALKELQRKAFILLNNEGATPDQIKFSDVIRHALEPLVQEVKLSLIEAKTDLHFEIQQMHLLGGVSQIRNLAPYFTQKVELQVNKLRELPVQFGVDLTSTTKNDLTASLAIGLAIEGLRRPRNPAVNFLKADFAKQSQTLQNFMEKWSYALQIVGAAFLIFCVYAFLRETFAMELADKTQDVLRTQAAMVDLKGPRASLKNIKQFIKQKQQEEKNRELVSKVQKISSAMDVLNRVSQSIPSGRNLKVEVTHFAVNGENVAIEGTAGSSAEVERLKQALSGMSQNGKVDAYKSATGTHFSFKFLINRLKGG